MIRDHLDPRRTRTSVSRTPVRERLRIDLKGTVSRFR